MLSSIHPLGERARHNRWMVTITAYSLAAVAAGAAVGGVLGWAGSGWPLGEPERRWGLVAVALVAGLLDLARIRPPGPARQVNERWIGQYRGSVYGAGFGAQLGLGAVTFVVTWSVYAVYLIELLSGSTAAGAVIGGVFGGGRALAPMAAGWIDRPTRLTAFHRLMRRLGPPARTATGVLLVMVAALGLVG